MLVVRDHPTKHLEHIRALVGTVTLPIPGFGWSQPSEAWYRLIGQICAIGNSRAWIALDPVRDRLTICAIREQNEHGAVYVHRILADIGVRFCSRHVTISQKATAIVHNANSRLVADDSGSVCLLDQIEQAGGTPPPSGVLTAFQAKAARKLLIQNVAFFGPKSSSDFLLGLGLANSLLAFDVRILNLLVNLWGYDPSWRTTIHRLESYEQLEADVIERLCQPLGITPLELDRVLFYGYPHLKRLMDGYPT